MILKYDISKELVGKLGLDSDEEIFYAIPYDVDEDGSMLEDSFVVVSTRRLFTTYRGELKESFELTDIKEIIAEPLINCGVLILRKDDTDRILVRYSSKHLSRFAYIARGCRILISGCRTLVESDEQETTCPVCHRALPGTRECPHCSRQKSGIVRSLWKYMKNYRLMLVIIFILMLTAMAVTLINPALQRILVDDVIKDENGTIRGAMLVLLGMFALSIGIILVNAGKYYLCAKLGANIAMDLRKALYSKIQVS